MTRNSPKVMKVPVKVFSDGDFMVAARLFVLGVKMTSHETEQQPGLLLGYKCP